MATLRPTLWRTCRVLANRERLRIIQILIVQPELSVSAIADALEVSVSKASQNLRALSARGLLNARRDGKHVYYRLEANETIPETEQLLRALRRTFAASEKAKEHVFRMCTAFTHPRRATVFQVLDDPGLTFHQLRERTGMSDGALTRHLHKLMDRGFVCIRKGLYKRTNPSNVLARTLAKVVQET